MAHSPWNSPAPAPAPAPGPMSPMSPISHPAGPPAPHAARPIHVEDIGAEIAKALEPASTDMSAEQQERIILACASLAILFGLYNICKVLAYRVHSKDGDVEM